MSLTPEPLFFGPVDRPRFGWIHHAASERPRAGLVVCNPFGYEAVCAHRSLRHFAQAAAARDVTALRFDYDGTGDSAGGDRDPGRVAAWVASIRDAIETLRARTGVERVFLLGVRLGATLAMQAARGRTDVAGVIVLAPVVSGRAYLRELRALQMTLGHPPAPTGTATATDVRDDEREAVGFVLTAETQQAIGQIDLAKDSGPPPRQLLLIERDDLPGPEQWATALADAGVELTRRRLPGYPEMVLDPHKAVVPDAAIAATTEWIAARLDGEARPAAPAASQTEARVSVPDATVREQAVFLDEERRLFGILTRADAVDAAHAAELPRLGIVLLNAGAVHHIGPNRLYVELARRWAAQGHVVLRADLAGLGDSVPRPGAAENVVYSPRAVDDVAATLAFLERQPGVGRCLSVGLCSGAYHGFKAALAGLPLAGVVLINPLTFFWKEGMSLDYPAYKVVEEAQRYAESLFRLESWRKLLSGKGRPRLVAQVVARHAASLLARRLRDAARMVNRPLPEDLGHDLEVIARRKIPLHFVFAAGDPGLGLLRIQSGSALPTLKRRHELTVDLIEGPDHTFTPVWSHAVLLDRLSQLVGQVAR